MFMTMIFSSSTDQTYILLLLLALISLYLLVQNKKNSRKTLTSSKLPPSPPKLPLIGNLHQLPKLLPHLSLSQLSQSYGPLMFLQLGHIPTLVVSSAAMAEEVLKTHDLSFCSRPSSPGPKMLSYNFLDVAFSPFGHHWREMRRLFVSELLHPKRDRSFWRAREVEIDHLVNHLSQLSPKCTLINIDEEIFDFVSGVMSRVAFGKRYGVNKDQKLKDFLQETMWVMGSFSAEDFFPSFGWIVDGLSGIRRRKERCCRKLDEYFEMILEDHLDAGRKEEEEYCEDFVDVLIRMSKTKTNIDQSSSFRLTKDHIKALLLNTFAGGVDTTAVTMVWAMAELINNPRVMHKVQSEIRSHFPKLHKYIRPEHIQELPYLHKVTKETLRLHPPAPLLIPHESITSCNITGGTNDNYHIRPRTRVLVNAYAIGRDPNTWKDPNEFYPERFDDCGIDFRGKCFELLPFGAGRRSCPAINIAIETMEFGLANLLYWFDWKVPGSGDQLRKDVLNMEEDGGLTIHKKMPLCVVLLKYSCQG